MFDGCNCVSCISGCTLLRGSGTVETEHPYAVDFTQCWTLYVPDGLVREAHGDHGEDVDLAGCKGAVVTRGTC